MQIDSMVGIGVFLVFVAWSFNFYSLNFQQESEPLKELADRIHEDVIGYLEADVYSVPVRFNSPGSTTGTVLYLAFSWPQGTKNSTKVKEGGASLACEIMDDYVYWQSDLDEGNNYFTLEIANTSIAMECQGSFNKSVVNHTLAYGEEKVKLVSQTRIASMAAMSYSDFKGAIGLSGADFRVKIENTTGTIEYGLTIPKNRNVYVPVSSNRIWESDEPVNISVAVWM